MAKPTGVVTASALNLRGKPSTDGPVLASLSRGTAVEVLDHTGTWYEVHTDKGDGFVASDFVKIVDSQPAAGFLYERADLKAVPLAPAAGDQITLGAKPSAAQRMVAQTWNAQGGLVQALSDIVGLAPAAAVSVLCVESGGRGFADDGRMIIRFENHVLWDKWGQQHADVFKAHFRFNAEKRWLGHQFRTAADGPWEPCHTSQTIEWRVFGFARGLDERAAVCSISMGGPQIMGFNSAQIGYEDPEVMFANFAADVRFQILGLFDFIKGAGTTSSMLQALQQKRFDSFAARYNGPGQAAEYGSRIDSYYTAFTSLKA